LHHLLHPRIHLLDVVLIMPIGHQRLTQRKEVLLTVVAIKSARRRIASGPKSWRWPKSWGSNSYPWRLFLRRARLRFTG
jgi:hypothetical protein